MDEALLYDILPNDEVRCKLCAHRCRIAKGAFGLCATRENRHGTLIAHTKRALAATAVDPIEKKPFYHVYPGSKSYSIATPGCNFNCLFCQNHTLSQGPRENKGTLAPRSFRALGLVAEAKRQGCRTLAFTYSEPTIFTELALEVATVGAEFGLGGLWVTNGYQSAECRDLIAPFMLAANVDLKAFREASYRRFCGAGLAPILDTIADFVARGIWVEVTTLLVPDFNTDPGELRELAAF